MAFLEIRNLTKRFGAVDAVRDASLDVARGGVCVLLGPSGSGKTTLLRCVAGFETPDAGRIVVDGQDVTRLRPEARRFGMVFQHYALFPHLDVFGNVAFGLEARGWPRDRIRARVREVLALVDLEGLDARRVDALSGGQQQRVALARALAPEPRVLLLDEPLSNLDPALRERTRRELRAVIDRVGITTLFVTHDQEEAFDLGDRIAVIHDGRIEQVGTPEDLYERPATFFVATFVGRAGWWPGRLAEPPRAGDGTGTVEVGPARWPARVVGDVPPGAPVRVVARPEWLALDAADPRACPARVVARRYTGPVAYLTVECLDRRLDVMTDPATRPDGETVRLAPRRPLLAYPA